MRTGEGKTLMRNAAGLPQRAGGQGGVHVVTVNDYLAKRDADWMGRIYRFLGMSVGTILSHAGQRIQDCRLRRRHHLRHQQRSTVSTTCATTWNTRWRTAVSAGSTTPSLTRSTRS